jgi:hypothetical protein
MLAATDFATLLLVVIPLVAVACLLAIATRRADRMAAARRADLDRDPPGPRSE